jgi:hypothetical protein
MPATAAETAPVAWPLKVSASGRYLTDRDGVPFLMVGDSPQALIGNVSLPDARMYLRNRAGYGINALWIDLLCNDTIACDARGRTWDGIAPFTTQGDLSTPDPAYFQRAEDMIRLAADNGMVVFLDPIETAGWLPVLRANGIARAREYGAFVGRRFAALGNIIWLHGNDFQSWRVAADDAVVRAVAEGIREVDRAHLQTVELNYVSSASLDDPAWAPLVDLDAVYTYLSTYAALLGEYRRPWARPGAPEGARPGPMPIFMVEANYEFEHNPGTEGGSLSNLRRQEYWTMLSGATGQFYGSGVTWPFRPGWRAGLDTPGVRQLSRMKQLFAPRRWYDLVPDYDHTTLIAGHGVPVRTRVLSGDSYVTAARTPDGSLFIAYLPTAHPVTVDMTRLADKVTARWYDPTRGTFQPAVPEVGPESGADTVPRDFTPPGPNGAGDGDWVLILSRE